MGDHTPQSEQEMVFAITKENNSELNSSSLDDEPKTKAALISTRKEMKDAFRFIDQDNTGTITFENMKLLVKQIGADFTDDDIRDMMKEADNDGSGEIDVREFFKIMRRTEILCSSSQSPHQGLTPSTPDRSSPKNNMYEKSPPMSTKVGQGGNESMNGLNKDQLADMSLDSDLTSSK